MNRLETKVLEMIGEDPDSPDVFLDTDAGMAPIRDSLNDAIQEITCITGSKISTYPLPLRQEQMFYRFALNTGYFGWVTDAWNVNQGLRLEQTDLIKLNAHDRRWMIPTGEPRAYFQIGLDVIGFYPKSGSDSNTIELKIVEIPKAYTTDADRINLRNDFEHAAIHYAVAEYWAGRGDAREASDHMSQYLSILGIEDAFTNSRDRVWQLQTQKEAIPKETS